MKKEKLSSIVDIALVCLAGFGLIWLAVPISIVRLDIKTAALAAIIYGVIFSLMFLSKRFAAFAGIMAGLAGLSCLIVFWLDPKAFDWLTKGTTSYFAWITASASGFIRQDIRWENLSLFIASSVIMVLAALVLFRPKRAVIPFICVFAAGMGLLVGQRILNLQTEPLSVLFFGFVALTLFIRATWPKGAPSSALPGRGRYILMFVPFVVVGVIFGSLIYNNDSKTDRSILKRVQDFIEQVRPKYMPPISYFDYFSISEMGYNNTGGELGGLPNLSGDVKLFIIADKPTYLAGRVSYDYSDNRWNTSEHEWFRYENRTNVYDFLNEEIYTDPSHLDTMEMRAGQLALYPQMEGELPENPGTLKTQNIIFGAMSTKTLFLPQDVMAVLLGRGLTKYQDSRLVNIDGEQLLTGGQQDRDFYYEVQYMETNLTYTQRLELLRLSHPGLYRETADNFEELYSEDKGSFLSKKYMYFLADYADWVRAEYTRVPEEMPQRVRDLALEITDGYDNDLDKAQAIRDYLVNNYEYSFDVLNTPEGEDFVDYFLFDLKKGYCSYFATAMAILGREAGLPTRYVEGFRPETRRLDDVFYFATGFNAHAWVEVYFEGYGWVAFEPTPPFRYDFDFYFLSREAMAETYDDTYYDTPYFEVEPEEEEDYVAPDQEIESLHFLNFFIELARVFVILLLAAIAIAILLIIVNTIRHRRRLRFNTQTAETIAYAIRAYKYILRILSELDLPIMPDETPIEFGQRVDAKQFRDFEGSVERTCEIYSAAVYGQMVPSIAEARLMRETTLALLEVAKRRLGSARFFVYQSIMGRF